MRIAILTSGIGFGVYIPALILKQQLSQQGVIADLEIIETLFTEDKKNKLRKNCEACQKELSIAKAVMRLPMMQQQDNYDSNSVKILLEKWQNHQIQYFIVFSGSWQPILEEYKHFVSMKISLYGIHLDTIFAPSWKKFNMQLDRVSWLVGEETKLPECAFWLDDNSPILFEEREKRVLMHGGGWGIGIANEKENIRKKTEYSLYVITTKAEKISKEGKINLFHTNGWQAWDCKEEEFPPLFSENNRENLNRKKEHYIYQLARNSKAIISKAGGGTLLESFSGAIPVIFTEWVGKHEEQNQNAWRKHGFGITWKEWEETDFSEKVLEECYQNLMVARQKIRFSLKKEIINWLTEYNK